MKRVLITLLIVAAAIALIAYVLTQHKQDNEAKAAVVAETGGTVAVTAMRAVTQEISLDFSSNGNFAANQDLMLLAEASGRITNILVSEGSRVSKGQVLAHIDAEYASLDVQRAEDALQKLRVDYDRYKSSFETGGVTRAQLDDIEFNLRNTENQVQQAKRRLSDSYVKAPISGVINKRVVEVGAFVSPGTELFEIVDISRLKLDVAANEYQVVHLKVGDRVDIQSSVFPDRKFSGTIRFIAPKADNTLSYPVEVLVDNDSAEGLRAGMYGTATFKLPQQAPSIVVPRTAFAGSVSSNQVYVVQDSTAVLKSVTPGRILGEQVEILHGLEEGEIVISGGQINLVDGVKVTAQVRD